MQEPIYLASPHMRNAEGYELKYILEAFDTNWIAPLDSNAEDFEKEPAGKVGVRAAARLLQETAAIHLAFRVKRGDLVFCRALTFSASANPVRYGGAVPIFMDSDRTWCRSARCFPGLNAMISVESRGETALLGQPSALPPAKLGAITSIHGRSSKACAPLHPKFPRQGRQ